MAALLGLATLSLATVACTNPDNPWPGWPTTTSTTTTTTTTTTAPVANAVTFQTAEFTITRMSGIVRPGVNEITIVNAGQYTHEVIFVQADNYASLPKKENGAVDMSQVPMDRIAGDHHLHLAPGESATRTVTFSPGRWVAICNIEHEGRSHFARGQYLEFTVV